MRSPGRGRSSTYRLTPAKLAPVASMPGPWMSSSIRICGEKYATWGPITASGWPVADPAR